MAKIIPLTLLFALLAPSYGADEGRFAQYEDEIDLIINRQANMEIWEAFCESLPIAKPIIEKTEDGIKVIDIEMPENRITEREILLLLGNPDYMKRSEEENMVCIGYNLVMPKGEEGTGTIFLKDDTVFMFGSSYGTK